MKTMLNGDIHAGLSEIKLDSDKYELGEGILLTKTYAHLMAPFVMAFKPAPPGGHHPAPWKPASGGFSFDVLADLFIPKSVISKFGSPTSVAKTIVFLLRLGVNPATTLAVISNHPFSNMIGMKDDEVKILPLEIKGRYFSLSVNQEVASDEQLEWVRDIWKITHKMINENAEFAFAVQAIDSGQFVESSALALVLLWGALERLFLSTTAELKFRVSSLISVFLENPGEDRLSLQKQIAKLYDKRSAAAHGKPKHEDKELLATFNILRDVLLKIIEDGKIPRTDDLEKLLFGVT